jgi:SAM-dependent methyltransferase
MTYGRRHSAAIRSIAMPDDIEYVGLMAEAWDALRGDTSDWVDRAWFREVVRRGGEPVLDVGCGTGRLLLDFLADGVDIDGIDNAPDMLERLHAKAAAAGMDVDGRVHLGRMQLLRLPRRYRTVMVPSSSFQLLLEPDDAAEAMRRFFALLVPGGSLAMPFLVMDKPYEERWTKEATLEDGSIVRRTAVATFDPAVGIEATDDLYEVFTDGELVRTEHFVRPRATRAYTREQARLAYEGAGFVDLEWGADFTLDDRPTDWVFTVVGHRPD